MPLSYQAAVEGFVQQRRAKLPHLSWISGERDGHWHAEPVEGVQNRTAHMHPGNLSL